MTQTYEERSSQQVVLDIYRTGTGEFGKSQRTYVVLHVRFGHMLVKNLMESSRTIVERNNRCTNVELRRLTLIDNPAFDRSSRPDTS